MSTYFLPHPDGHIATFDELLALSNDKSRHSHDVNFVTDDGEGHDKLRPATNLMPGCDYALQDSEGNTLWVNFDESGRVLSAERHGGSSVEDLLFYLADDMVSDKDERYEEISVACGAALPKNVGGPSIANVPRASSPAVEHAANRLVKQLIG